MSKGMYQLEQLFDMPVPQQNFVGSHLGCIVTSTDDQFLIEQLRSGNETAFVWLIDRYAGAMQRLAMVYVKSWSVAEEVVQETWMAILEGLHRFEGRSSLKTWIFRILTNCAITRAQREGRSIPFSSLQQYDADSDEPAVDPDSFFPIGHQWAGQWISFPSNWSEMPEDRLLSEETRACIEGVIATLPPNLREIIILRDVEGWTSEETCHFLGISEGYQRVLLHRARSKVRNVLAKYFEEK